MFIKKFKLILGLGLLALSVNEVKAQCTTTSAAPTNLTKSSESKRSVSYSWTDTAAWGGDYRGILTPVTAGVPAPPEDTYDGSSGSLVTKSGLTPGQEYRIKVCLYDNNAICTNGGVQVCTAEINFTTQNDVPTSPATAFSVNVPDVNAPRDIELTWSFDFWRANHASGLDKWEVYRRDASATLCPNSSTVASAESCLCGSPSYSFVTSSMTHVGDLDTGTLTGNLSYTVPQLPDGLGAYCFVVVPRNGEGVPPANHLADVKVGYLIQSAPTIAPVLRGCSQSFNGVTITRLHGHTRQAKFYSTCLWRELSGIEAGRSTITSTQVQYQVLALNGTWGAVQGPYNATDSGAMASNTHHYSGTAATGGRPDTDDTLFAYFVRANNAEGNGPWTSWDRYDSSDDVVLVSEGLSSRYAAQ